MTNTTPSGAKKHRESTEPESHQTAKMFFFLLLLLLTQKLFQIDCMMNCNLHLCVLVDRSPGFATWNNCHGHYTIVSGASVGVTTNWIGHCW